MDGYELEEKLTEHNEKQRRKFSKHDWKFGLLDVRMSHSGLTLKSFFHNLIPSLEHSQCVEDSALCTRWGVILMPGWGRGGCDLCLGGECGRG